MSLCCVASVCRQLKKWQKCVQASPEVCVEICTFPRKVSLCIVCVKSCLRSFFVRKQASYMRPLVGTRLKWQLFNNYWGVTGKHTRGLLHSLLGNEWWTTGALTGALPGALTGALTGALSDSYSVTTEELLVNRPGHYCICYWVVISSK